MYYKVGIGFEIALISILSSSACSFENHQVLKHDVFGLNLVRILSFANLSLNIFVKEVLLTAYF